MTEAWWINRMNLKMGIALTAITIIILCGCIQEMSGIYGGAMYNGEPVAGADVTLYNLSSGSVAATGVTGTNGTFGLIGQFFPGHYGLKIEKGLLIWQGEVNVTVPVCNFGNLTLARYGTEKP